MMSYSRTALHLMNLHFYYPGARETGVLGNISIELHDLAEGYFDIVYNGSSSGKIAMMS
jgi:hypothetical protein